MRYTMSRKLRACGGMQGSSIKKTCESARRILKMPIMKTKPEEQIEALNHLLHCNECFSWSFYECEKIEMRAMKRSKAKMISERNMFGCRIKVKHGWSYMGRIVIYHFNEQMQKKLAKEGDAVTVKERDRYIQYVNNGEVTASGKQPLIDFYRRFFKRHW